MTDQLYMTMNDGHNIPVVGLGTWKSEPGDSTYNAVFDSIKAGYRHIDTARAYDNESDVGRAINAADVPRENLFITTKLWNKDQGYGSALEACEKSLARLDCGYIDLYLIHWPLKDLRNDSWKAFIELQKRGLCRSIGVSNFTIDNLKELEEKYDVLPAINQVEFHPYHYQKELLEYCNSKSIIIQDSFIGKTEDATPRSPSKFTNSAPILAFTNLDHSKIAHVYVVTFEQKKVFGSSSP